VKETLAAGIVLLSGYDGAQPFADIMCGSGTFVIEAALIASNTPPGLKRNFAFESWGLLKEEDCKHIRSEAEAKIIKSDIRLLGSDIDKRAVVTAKQNAERASVGDIAAFQTLDFKVFSSKKKNGVLVINPPYGQRIGENISLRDMYAGLRGVFENLDGWKMFVLCGNEDFQRFYGKKAEKNRKLYNGDLLTYLYQYF
jgi:putative N6-adenine-specific DNA methylase